MSRKKNILYKSFTLSPYSIYKEEKDPTSKELVLKEVDRDETLGLIREDVEFVTEHVFETLEQQGTTILDHYQHYRFEKEQQWREKKILQGKDPDDSTYSFSVQNNTVGRELGYVISKDDYDDYLGKTQTGRSRYTFLYQDRLFREVSSWYERVCVTKDSTDKYVSSGWKRTVRSFAPQKLAPKVSLNATDVNFTQFLNNPLEDNEFTLRLVIKGYWYRLYFKHNKDRFSDATKVCLPDITIDEKGIPRFHFSVEYDYVYGDISKRYLVGLDVGITTYATVVVWDTQDKCIVHVSTLSQEVHSLYNSIRASDRQKIDLVNQGRYEEAELHRHANINKKKELAILSAREIAEIAFVWDNALVMVEELSWIENTMQNGRWNRGELVKWITHYVELNGSRVFKVNASGSSQECHVCGEKVSHPEWGMSVCPVHGVMDRDVSAACIIAQRGEGILQKVLVSRSKSKSYQKGVVKRRSKVPHGHLKHPGNKNNAKKKSKKPRHYHSLLTMSDVRNSLDRKNKEVCDYVCSSYRNDDGMVCEDEKPYGMFRTLEKQHDFNYNKLSSYSLL